MLLKKTIVFCFHEPSNAANKKITIKMQESISNRKERGEKLGTPPLPLSEKQEKATTVIIPQYAW